MSTASPTLIPRTPYFPMLLADPPKPYPIPLPPRSDHPPDHMKSFRNLLSETDDLSDEEHDIEETWNLHYRMHGHRFLHVIGRLYTRQEEKNDQADSDSDESGSARSGAPASNMDDGENESVQDLDANMEDLDEEPGDNTGDTEDLEEGVEYTDDLDDEGEL